MKLILAVDKNWAIGKGGQMIYDLKKDLKHFKQTTLGEICIMGRKTYESIGGPLPKRENIVISKNKDLDIEDVKVYSNKKDLFSYLKDTDKEVFLIGGANLVASFIDYIDEAIITKIDGSKDADTFVHNFDEDENFYKSSESKVIEDEGFNIKFVNYKRK